MAWIHPDHPGRRVRLGYCTNVLPVETLPDLRRALTDVAVPLRERLQPDGVLGIGLHLPATLAAFLASPEGSSDLHELGQWLAQSGFDPFTYNAFPFGGFHQDGLKENVYRPTWSEVAREQYTLDVAAVACSLVDACRDTRPDEPRGHLSISTHPGSYGPWITDRSELTACADAMARVVAQLAQLSTPAPLVLALEAEPFASSSNTQALVEYLVVASSATERELMRLGSSPDRATELTARHLGVCLDACHSAVEFEDPARAWALSSATALTPASKNSPALNYCLGKVQFSSALTLHEPGADPEGRELLLGMSEPRYLHQIRAQSPADDLAQTDLPALSAVLKRGDELADSWLAAPEWRCHFHVPVDLERYGSLGTTRAHADALLSQALAQPATWPSGELHVEVETYTWSVLPSEGRPAGSLVDGLERELRHVERLLTAAGWSPS